MSAAETEAPTTTTRYAAFNVSSCTIVPEKPGMSTRLVLIQLPPPKVGAEWKVTLRKGGRERDYWWVEWFDAVVVASGHYWVPYVPAIEGLEQLEKTRPGSVIHSKHFRGRELYKDKAS